MRHRIAALLFAAALLPQKPSFEVASIKPNNSRAPLSQTSIDDERGYFSTTNATLKQVIRSGYRLLDYQIVGGPDWIDTARFDFEAKAEGAAFTAPNLKPGETRSDVMAEMIQALLEERFQLKVHREIR